MFRKLLEIKPVKTGCLRHHLQLQNICGTETLNLSHWKLEVL